MTAQQAVSLMLAELVFAEAKHPKWPDDRLRQVAVVAEEAGEALQAALTIIETEEALVAKPQAGYDVTLAYNGMAKLEENLQAEIVSTGAMALRWLMNRRPLYANAKD